MFVQFLQISKELVILEFHLIMYLDFGTGNYYYNIIIMLILLSKIIIFFIKIFLLVGLEEDSAFGVL
jgi:hypothetical protein